jgi:hypothetical protein
MLVAVKLYRGYVSVQSLYIFDNVYSVSTYILHEVGGAYDH